MKGIWFRTVLSTGVLALAMAGTATAQTTGIGAKAMTATGSTANGLSVKLSAAVARDTTAGEGCVSVTGDLKRREVREGGCGRLTVEIDDLLNSGRVRGAVAGVTLDVSVSGSGVPTPADTEISYPNYPSCNGFFYVDLGCYLAAAVQAVVGNTPNALVKRDGLADGVLSGSRFATTRFSGTGTLYLERTVERRG
jgi:hypothetical protein